MTLVGKKWAKNNIENVTKSLGYIMVKVKLLSPIFVYT